MAFTSLLLALCGTAPILDASGRPVLSGPEQVHLSADGRFRVHWTTEGRDRLTSTADVDPENGVPDTVDWVEVGVGTMYAATVGVDGWPVPNADEGVGGDDRLDIYLRDLSINGCTHYVTLPSGHKAAYVEVAPARISLGKVSFESIAAHELHHVFEFTVSDRMPNWIAEGSATYAQYLLFSDGAALDVARLLLWRLRIGLPQLALDTVGNDYEYAGMVWVKYLVDRNGSDRKKLLALWQAFAQTGDVDAGHDAFVAARLGLPSFDAAAADYAVWNWFACSNDDGRHYDMATAGCDSGNVTTTNLTSLPADGDSVAVERRGSAYLLIPPDCATDELDLTLRAAGPMRFQLVEERPPAESPVLAADGPANADASFTVAQWNQFRRLGVVATSLGAAPATFHYSVRAQGDVADHLPADAKLALTIQAPALQAGESSALALDATFGFCAVGRDVRATATWRSSDASIASVDGGRLVAHRAGTAEISATIGSVSSNSVTVTVGAAPGGCAVGGRGLSVDDVIWILCIPMWDIARRHNKSSKRLPFPD